MYKHHHINTGNKLISYVDSANILLVMNQYKVMLNFETHISHIETTLLLNMKCYQDLDKEFSAVLLEQFV